MPLFVSNGIISGSLAVVFTRGPKGNQGITGNRGATGYSAKILIGTAAPINSFGTNSDLFINKTTYDVYGPKTNGAWGGIVANIKGPQGPTGAAGAAGAAGATGAAPTLIGGTITALSYGSTPTAAVVYVAGTTWRIDLGVPTGPTGAAGPAGPVSDVTGNIVTAVGSSRTVNQVQADFDSVSGLSQILNLPTVRLGGAFSDIRGYTIINGIVTASSTLTLPAYANNAAAIAGGVAVGRTYRTGGDPDLLAVVH